uniref:Polynucleotide 5'-hydroxyl-kinase NOL9 n=1 Tax=Latimeria chalumnae TaxID=7897 RepID=H3BAT4_LATCH
MRNADTDEVDGDSDYWRAYVESFTQNGASRPQSRKRSLSPDTAAPSWKPYLAAVEAGNGASIILMEPTQKLTFRGKCQLTCLYGNLQVFGFTISQGQPAYDLFSPATHCPLTIEALEHSHPGRTKKEMRMEARAILRECVPLATRRLLMKEFRSCYTILLLNHLETKTSSFICSYPDYCYHFFQKEKMSTFDSDTSPLISVGITSLPASSGLMMSESGNLAVFELLKACLEEDDGCPVILVCGAKNIGKSTFNRLLINSLLNDIPCVEYLECDLGQTEFTPPGCVSLHRIIQPLLGPPFLHQRAPRRMVYYGRASSEQDMERYEETVKYIFSSYKREAPLIINTMGWVKGFGLMLLIDLIRLLSPTHVVQISTRDRQDMPPLTPDYVRTAAGFLTKGNAQARPRRAKQTEEPSQQGEEDDDDGGSSSSSDLIGQPFTAPGHTLLKVQAEFAGAGDSNAMSWHSNVLRDLATLGYLSQICTTEPGTHSPLHAFTPYQVPFNAVALWVIHCGVAPAQILYCMNANLVGICRIADSVGTQTAGPILLTQTPVCECLGFGIVRGIDMEKKVYYVLTPVPPEKLRLANCLLIGGITIPHAVLKFQPDSEGELPYATTEYNFEISGAGKIKVNKQLKRREHCVPLPPS